MKELGFWEVNEFTLQDVHEVAPSQEEMQAAADAKASADAREGLPVRLALPSNSTPLHGIGFGTIYGADASSCCKYTGDVSPWWLPLRYIRPSSDSNLLCNAGGQGESSCFRQLSARQVSSGA